MEIKNSQTIDRINLHSHITGLGHSEAGVEYNKDGFVGQINARKAMGLVKKLVENNTTGRLVLIKGDGGTGKTALAIGLSKSLGDTNFTSINATEIYSLEMSKCEALIQALRKSIGLRIKETIKVIEGEVVSITGNRVVLKTVDMESSFDIGKKMREEFDKERVSSGDVVRIIKERGKVYKIGTSTIKKNETIGLDAKFIPCPEGELVKLQDDIQNISLHEIDVVNNKAQGYLALFSGETGEIKPEVRDEVNKKVWNWVNEGKAEIVRGILFIDEVHMLDVESFAFLNKALEEDFCPVIVMASNKTKSFIRGTNEEGYYGMPRDFFDRVLVVSTEKYTINDFKEIIQHRINEEDLKVEENALLKITQIAQSSGLRYAMNLLSIAGIRAAKKKGIVKLEDVERVFDLFLDDQRCTINL